MKTPGCTWERLVIRRGTISGRLTRAFRRTPELSRTRPAPEVTASAFSSLTVSRRACARGRWASASGQVVEAVVGQDPGAPVVGAVAKPAVRAAEKRQLPQAPAELPDGLRVDVPRVDERLHGQHRPSRALIIVANAWDRDRPAVFADAERPVTEIVTTTPGSVSLSATPSILVAL